MSPSMRPRIDHQQVKGSIEMNKAIIQKALVDLEKGFTVGGIYNHSDTKTLKLGKNGINLNTVGEAVARGKKTISDIIVWIL